MSYIGTPPSNAFTSLLKQDFSTSATTGYTLDHAVNNANDIALFINFVRQEPTAGYAASGVNLTLTSATASSDDMYCVYLGQALQTVNPPNASVGSSQLSPIAITGQTAEATIATDDTILIHDTSASALRKMTRANFVSGIGGDNTPAFMAYKNGSQTISDTTTTNVTFAEAYDSNNAFASNTFTVPSGEAGKYFINASLMFYNLNTDLKMAIVYVKKNGNQVLYIREQAGSNIWSQKGINVSGILDLAVDDDITVDVYIDHTGGTTLLATGAEGESIFQGYKLIL
jgi:hypothetical protein